MHLLAGGELSLEWLRGDDFDAFYGGPKKKYKQIDTMTLSEPSTKKDTPPKN